MTVFVDLGYPLSGVSVSDDRSIKASPTFDSMFSRDTGESTLSRHQSGIGTGEEDHSLRSISVRRWYGRMIAIASGRSPPDLEAKSNQASQGCFEVDVPAVSHKLNSTICSSICIKLT